MKIVSLVPSITELLIDLGLKDQLIGITKFCIHPEQICKNIQKIGGTKNLNLELIGTLNPDIIIANKEENEKSQIEFLAQRFNVLITDVNSFEDALQMMTKIGEVCNCLNASNELITDIKNEFNAIPERDPKRKVIYLIWKNPFMVAGKNTFIDNMLEKSGLCNCISKERYPIIEIDELIKLNPDFIFLSTEPFPFKDSDKQLFPDFPSDKIKIVDGELFSWYGSRMKLAPKYFKQLLKELK